MVNRTVERGAKRKSLVTNGGAIVYAKQQYLYARYIDGRQYRILRTGGRCRLLGTLKEMPVRWLFEFPRRVPSYAELEINDNCGDAPPELKCLE